MPEKSDGTKRKRLHLLLGVFGLAAIAAAVHYGRVWHYERELNELGAGLVAEHNATDTIPVSEEGPEGEVEIFSACGFANLVYGAPQGKLSLRVTPRPHAPVQGAYELCYVYERTGGEWRMVESYVDHFPPPRKGRLNIWRALTD